MRHLTGIVTTLALTSPALAGVQWFTSLGADPSGDLAFQAAADGPLYENDFEAYPSRVQLDTIGIGPVDVDLGLVDFVGDIVDPTPGTFFSGSFNVPGTLYQNALLSQNWENRIIGDGIRFDFDQPVRGFGGWIFDDGAIDNSFGLEITLVDGTTLAGPSMSDGPFNIEGFLGVVAPAGMTGVTVYRLETGTPEEVFEVDHVQVVPMPLDCPADIDGDGAVTFSDLLQVLSQWGDEGPADIDENGVVDFGDLLLVLSNWGDCP